MTLSATKTPTPGLSDGLGLHAFLIEQDRDRRARALRDKRRLDVVISLLALIVLAPLMAGIAVLIRVLDGGPVLYRSERMRGPNAAFQLW